MGVFTEIAVRIEFETVEDTDMTYEILHKFEDKIKEHIYKDKPFHVNEPQFEGDGDYIEVNFNSGREPNARFHVDCLIKLMQIHKVKVVNFNAEIIQPDTYLCFDGQEDFDEHEINFE